MAMFIPFQCPRDAGL